MQRRRKKSALPVWRDGCHRRGLAARTHAMPARPAAAAAARELLREKLCTVPGKVGVRDTTRGGANRVH